jgi:hypothetical protein
MEKTEKTKSGKKIAIIALILCGVFVAWMIVSTVISQRLAAENEQSALDAFKKSAAENPVDLSPVYEGMNDIVDRAEERSNAGNIMLDVVSDSAIRKIDSRTVELDVGSLSIELLNDGTYTTLITFDGEDKVAEFYFFATLIDLLKTKSPDNFRIVGTAGGGLVYYICEDGIISEYVDSFSDIEVNEDDMNTFAASESNIEQYGLITTAFDELEEIIEE